MATDEAGCDCTPDEACPVCVPCDICREGPRECGCEGGEDGGGYTCDGCDGSGYRVPEHCCGCGGSPYCVQCHTCGASCFGACRCPVAVRLDGGGELVL
ncbi:hypothetical protein AB0K60_07170 [Thermopolyspora sp. NPDC052614]|uniref:hypothetical protein n=1 Tax=Thermopolyspora sp. NPDC052614 TaxID=3155682 RepID=UPI003424283E